MKETMEIKVEEYIRLRETINTLQTENKFLRAVVDSIKTVMQNSGMTR